MARPPSPLLAAGHRTRAVGAAVVSRFYADQCLVRASALAYTSLLSIVPLLAVMFAVLKGLGVQARLEGILLSRLSLNQETTDLIIGYIDRTNFGTLGALGAATLILTVISVLGTIEASFNFIWRVARQRPLWRKVTDYVGVVMLTPFLLLAGVAITSGSQAHLLVHWVLENGYIGGVAVRLLALSPVLINAVAIGILYAVMPNRRPAFGPIAISALVAGAAWQLVQWAYVALQVGVANNNAIYGALAQLPITLVWMYVSWAIVLFGAELAAVLEFGPELSHAGVRRDAIALHLLVRAADAFERGKAGVALLAVARELRVDPEMVAAVSSGLQQRAWIVPVEGAAGRVVLARDPHRIDLSELAELTDPSVIPPRADERVRAWLATADGLARSTWTTWHLSDVLEVEQEAARPDSPPARRSTSR